jgi:hypothetical protein
MCKQFFIDHLGHAMSYFGLWQFKNWQSEAKPAAKE